MPLHTERHDLEAEYDRLDERVAECAATYHDVANGSDAQQLAAQQGKQAERQRAGVAWALGYPDTPDRDGSGWDFDGTPELAFSEITVGERKLFRDTVDDTGWDEQSAYIAIATADAPYLAHDPEAIDPEEYRDTVLNVVELHPEFVAWADAKAEAASQGGDSGKSFMESVREQASTNSPETNG